MTATRKPHLRLGAPDRARLHRARLVEPRQDLGDAAVRDEELAGDVAGPDPHQGQLHDSAPHVVRQRATVHEHPAKLVDPGLACGGKNILPYPVYSL
jgi:hypothetical protein